MCGLPQAGSPAARYHQYFVLRTSQVDTHRCTDTLQLRIGTRNDVHHGRASEPKQLLQGVAHQLGVVYADAEAQGAETDLLDEVLHLIGTQRHVLMDRVHACVAGEGREVGHTVLRAAEQETEVRVEMGEELASWMSALVEIVMMV